MLATLPFKIISSKINVTIETLFWSKIRKNKDVFLPGIVLNTNNFSSLSYKQISHKSNKEKSPLPPESHKGISVFFLSKFWHVMM